MIVIYLFFFVVLFDFFINFFIREYGFFFFMKIVLKSWKNL